MYFVHCSPSRVVRSTSVKSRKLARFGGLVFAPRMRGFDLLPMTC
jgi:hypothetical protein